MSTKFLLILALILAGVAGAVYVYAKDELSVAPALTSEAISWRFVSNGFDEQIYGETTNVTLLVGGQSYDAGTYNGSCWELGKDTDPLLEGEISGIQCWFAGGGDEVGVFAQKGGYVVRHGYLEEPQGDGTPGMRGNFTQLFEIER
jgi:hypothetical protein